ncbi:hypothetical protein BH10ACT1_BH10ACT1_06620 [soil metagenome]
MKITAVVATLGIVIALVGIGLASRPLSTPSQDCGTAVSFLLGGRLNEFVDPGNPPKGVTRAEAEDNNADPCQERAANQARPAGVLVLLGALVALAALLTEFSARYRLHRKAGRAWAASQMNQARPAVPGPFADRPPPPPSG